MSRPGTRSKNKRQRQGDDGAGTLDKWRTIYRTNAVTEDDMNLVYMIWKPVCSGCRVNTEDNPNCFCALVPPPNETRESGLWQKTSDFVDSLGHDPSTNLRASSDYPAGLTNLGATCYVNTILQCLYMNKLFREGIFSVELDVLKQQPVLDQLARLFAQLHLSKKAFIDSSPFVKTLELDNGVQQDSHEFLTLLLSLLERCLSGSQISKARSIVQDSFRGSVSHVTTCLQCGRDSEASSKMEDFYELELNVKGLKSLDESLDDYLTVEELNGDNQYFCESCKARVDASRSIKLRTLPDVLNFHLKRYVFLPKTTTKKKVTSPFSFPAKLDMHHRLSDQCQSSWIYDLSAVLIHKGTTANSGHYIAHIKDEDTGQWWEFDDERVTSLGRCPFAEEDSCSTSKSVKNDVDQSNFSETTIAHSNRNGLNATDSHSLHVKTFSSRDAYMLMYHRKHTKNVCGKGDMASGANHMEKDGSAVSVYSDCLPSHFCEEIQNSNASYLEASEQYNHRKEVELRCINERRLEVRSVLAEAPVQPSEKPFFWISSDWLRKWAESVVSNAIDNTSIRCSHGKVLVSKVTSMKRLSLKSWNKLLLKYGGGPELSHDACCRDCLIDEARNVESADTYRHKRESFKRLAGDILCGNFQGGNYYVSRSWLQQWHKRKVADAPSKADAGPTEAIICQHGHLMHSEASGAKRVLVPEDFWLFLYEDAASLKQDLDNDLGHLALPKDSVVCSKCCDKLSEMFSWRLFKEEHSQSLKKLFSGKSMPLSLDCKYFLVPSKWISKLRNYINQAFKNSDELETLDGAINSLICEKHSRLTERPPELIFRGGAIVPKESSAGGLTIIPESDWKRFCEGYGAIETKGISAKIESINDPANAMSGSRHDLPICKDQLPNGDKVSNENGNSKMVIKTCPEVCESCIGERESCELMQKLNYCNEEICVVLVRGKEVPRSILEASKGFVETVRRGRKRSRKAKNGRSISLKVSASTSIYQLKMMIWESFGVVKENQILQKGDRTINIDDENATLVDVDIFAGDQIIVRDTQIHENRDISEELCDEKMDTSHTEEGFHGTLLTSNVSDKNDKMYGRVYARKKNRVQLS